MAERPLVIIPSYLRSDADAEVMGTCVDSIRQTVSDQVQIMVVDDASPGQDALDVFVDKWGHRIEALNRREENLGFSATVNVGLEIAQEQGREAILMNADMEMITPGWLGRCRKTTDSQGRKAALVGALLLYPSGQIQHSGIYFSLLTRRFAHLYQYAPGNLPEALHKRTGPVTGAFHYIRPETLEAVGLYDEGFSLGWEDVDYTARVFLAGLECVYNPNVRAYHHESLFRGRGRKTPEMAKREARSFTYFAEKYAEQSFSGWVPNL